MEFNSGFKGLTRARYTNRKTHCTSYHSQSLRCRPSLINQFAGILYQAPLTLLKLVNKWRIWYTPTVKTDLIFPKKKTRKVIVTVPFLERKPQRDVTVYQNCIIPCFKWRSTCFGRHTAHHHEPKTGQPASGFAYVEGCRTCSCWTLSGSVR